MALQPSDPTSGPGIGIAEEQCSAGSGVRRATFACQISGAIGLRGDAYASSLIAGGASPFDFNIINVTPPNPRLVYPMTPALYVVSGNGANWAAAWDIQFRVIGKDQFGNHQSELTPIIRLPATRKSAFIYLSKVFSSVSYATIKSHSLVPTNGAVFTIGIWPIWDTDLDSAETRYVGRLHQGIGLPLRCDTDPDRRETIPMRDIEHCRIVNFGLGSPTTARAANLRATRDAAPDSWGGFIYGDRFLNSSAAHGTYHTAGDLTDIIGGRWQGGTANKLRIVRRTGFTITAYDGSTSLVLVSGADVAIAGWFPDLMDIVGVVRSGLGTSQEGAFNTDHAWVS